MTATRQMGEAMSVGGDLVVRWPCSALLPDLAVNPMRPKWPSVTAGQLPTGSRSIDFGRLLYKLWPLSLVLGGLFLFLLTPAFARTYSATVVKVVDGDTVDVRVKSWSRTPFGLVSLRISGIDTPESMVQFAKCAKELALGIAAKAFARTLSKPGDAIRFVYLGHDKYFRIDAKVILPSGLSWADVMIGNGMAVPYTGGRKTDWCN